MCRRHEPWHIEQDRNLAETLERFATSIDTYAGHWLWTGAMNQDFYPTFSVNGLKWYAHRWGHGYFNGAHTSRQELDHVCGIELCVRPDHLFPVGKKENIRLRDRRLLMPDAWITPRNYRHIWTPRADQFAIQHGLPAPLYGLAV